jgi:hypothetical protein
MALSPEEKDDIVLLFLEGMDLYGLNTADSLDRILSLQALTREEVLSFLQSDQWLMADGQTAVVWEEDRPETSPHSPDWEWYVSLLVQKKGLGGEALIQAVSRAFQIAPSTAAEELQDLSFLDH